MGFKYIVSFTLSLILSALLYPVFIRYMKTLKLNQEISEYALSEFKEKSQTPTMGGVIFIIVPLLTLMILDYKAFFQIDVMLVVMAFIANGLIGFYDDYLILVKKDNIGFTTGKKFLLEVFLSVIFGVVWYFANDGNLGLSIPFTQWTINVGWLYFFVIIIMLSGVSNAVNITDGMDGLAGGTVFLAIIPYLFYAINQENIGLALLLFAVLGSLLTYLFYNVKPAKIIMGDVGSLSLGALLASSAIVLGYELALIIVGGIFLINTLTVIIQVGSVKLTGKRVFPYTPIHYSFIIWGIREKRVVYLFWGIGFILMLFGLLIGVLS
ncbi:MAG: phospho-N-acetylmuramoyl-pentapeptide-transferase [Erysipelothrix sp.]|nr:phospho-N-acetylmuramoyl-pentapeptide-transferase [Erysipelothrix sp.]